MQRGAEASVGAGTTRTGRVAGTARAAGTAGVALVVGALLLGQPALADEGLATAATSRYVLDAKETTVDAAVAIELRNVNPDQGDLYFYYDAFTVPVPAGAEDLRARSAGTSLPVRLTPTEDPSTSLARISFPDLRYGRSRTIELTFSVPGEEPRDEDGTRVGPGYATFAVYGVGDPGSNRVEVVAPTAMTFDATSDDFTSSTEGATTTHVATTSTQDEGFWAVVSLRDPAKAEERAVDVSGNALLLSGFPDDPEWADFVAEQVTTGIPVLERLVGTPWPGGLERIREDASPSVRGYDGWFDPGDDEIVIGEALDADLLFHELSHAWVSGERFDERWVFEGLAQVLAERTVRATGGDPADREEVSRRSRDAVPLNAWDGSASGRSEDVDAYAYPAAYTATSALLADLDDTELAAVVGAGIRGERAYDPPGTKDADGGRTSWSRWLDLLEVRAGVADAAQVFQRWALTTEQRAQFAPRAEARAEYAAVDEEDGAWLPPEGLRDAMTAWDFERASSVNEKVAGLGAEAVRVQDAAARAGLDVPEPVRESYEEAEHDEQYAALATTLPAAATAITAVGRAQDVAEQDRDPVSDLGVTVLGVEELASEATSQLEAGELAAATESARAATSAADRALLVGLVVPLALVLLLLALVVVTRRVLGRRARRRAAAGAAAVAAAAAAAAPAGQQAFLASGSGPADAARGPTPPG